MKIIHCKCSFLEFVTIACLQNLYKEFILSIRPWSACPKSPPDLVPRIYSQSWSLKELLRGLPKGGAHFGPLQGVTKKNGPPL